jgi:hypothetical protein
MQMPRAHPRWGIEFYWLGVDREGHVAAFTTGQVRPASCRLSPALRRSDAALEQVEELPRRAYRGMIDVQ